MAEIVREDVRKQSIFRKPVSLLASGLVRFKRRWDGRTDFLNDWFTMEVMGCVGGHVTWIQCYWTHIHSVGLRT